VKARRFHSNIDPGSTIIAGDKVCLLSILFQPKPGRLRSRGPDTSHVHLRTHPAEIVRAETEGSGPERQFRKAAGRLCRIVAYLADDRKRESTG